MRRQIVGSIPVLLVAVAFSQMMFAQAARPGANAGAATTAPDLSGVWLQSGGNVFDHHERLVELMRKELPPVDQAVAALLSDLDQRGLLEHVLVCVLTDFGRDQMNNIAGRHHWADCGCATSICIAARRSHNGSGRSWPCNRAYRT